MKHMKTMIKKWVVLCLLVCIAASGILTGCSKPVSNGVSKETAEAKEFKATQHVLIKKGTSDYEIVIADDSTNLEKYAAEELQYFLSEATNCVLPIVQESERAKDKAYLSVGGTKLLASQESIVIDYKAMGESGTSIDTIDENVYIAGATDYGTLFSVYRFLYYQIGYKAYAPDCIDYDYYETLKLLDFDYHYRPTIDMVCANDRGVFGKDNTKNAARMYLRGYDNGTYEIGRQIYGEWCHTVTIILSPHVYQPMHPEWYSAGQLCLSNEEMIKEFSNNVIKNYASTAKTPVLMIGGEDNHGYCQCSVCTEDAAKYGGPTGIYLRFLNKVAANVEQYYEENGIKHDYELVGLFYAAYEEAPVIKNEDGTFTPVDESIIPDSEGQVTVTACYAPIHACYTHSFFDETCELNQSYCENLKAWSSLTGDKLYLYTYGANFTNAKFHYNNWTHMAEFYKGLRENNIQIKNLFDESQYKNNTPMIAMRTYVRSSLAWNPDQNLQELIQDFMKHYYGVGAEYVEEYFNEVLGQFEQIYAFTGTACQGCFYPSGKAEYWPHDTLLNYCNILQNGMTAIEDSEYTEQEKELYTERLYREYVLMKCCEYDLHAGYLTTEELAELEPIVKIGKEVYGVQ